MNIFARLFLEHGMRPRPAALRCIVIGTALAMPPAHAAQRFADFPVAAKMTAAARVGDKVYAGLGSAGHAWYVLDLSRADAPWRTLAPFPAQPRDNANAVAVGSEIYLFNGQGKAQPDDPHLTMFDTVWKYDTLTDTWKELPTRSPMGGLGAAATTLDQQTILFFGGVNKSIFDRYQLDYAQASRIGAIPDRSAQAGATQDSAALIKAAQEGLNQRYFNQRPQDYQFTTQVLQYNPASNQWRPLGEDPAPATAGAAIATNAGHVTLIGGEIKPGLRSPMVKHLDVSGTRLNWQQAVAMAPAPGETVQEGIAGAYAGYSAGILLAAGGANFPGAWRQFKLGQLYAHQGLRKTWRDDIYAAIDGTWQAVGKLPAPMGYSAYVQLDEGVLVIGGELQGGGSSNAVYLLKWNGKTIDIVD